MINRNAYHNAMRCGTLLSAPRPDAQHRATRLYSTQRFVCYQRNSAMRIAPLRSATLRHSAQRFVCSHRYSTQLYSPPRMAPQLNSTICLLSTPRFSSNRATTLLNDLFITTRRIDTRLSAPQLSATICLLSSPLFELHLFEPRLDAAHCASTRRYATHLHSTQRFVCLHRFSTRQCAAKRNSTPLNDLFVPTLLSSSLRITPHRASPLRTATNQ